MLFRIEYKCDDVKSEEEIEASSATEACSIFCDTIQNNSDVIEVKILDDDNFRIKKIYGRAVFQEHYTIECAYCIS